MSLIAKELGRALVTGTNYATANTLVANATGKDTMITKITAYNAHTAAVTLTLLRVLDSAGTVAVGTVTEIFWSKKIGAGKTEIWGHWDVSLPLTDTNDSLQAYADVASKVNVFVDGFVMSDQS